MYEKLLPFILINSIISSKPKKKMNYTCGKEFFRKEEKQYLKLCLLFNFEKDCFST